VGSTFARNHTWFCEKLTHVGLCRAEKKQKKGGEMESYIAFVGVFEAAVGREVAKLSTFCARRPKWTIFVFLVLCLALMAGFATIEIEFRGRNLWVDQNSEPMKNLEFTEEIFSPGARRNQIYITSKNGGNVLTFKGIRDAFTVHNEILEIASPVQYSEICDAGQTTQCNVEGPLKFWNFNLTEFLTSETDDASVGARFAELLYPSFELVVRDIDFGGFRILDGVAEATAIMLAYNVREGEDLSTEEDQALEWEAEFIKVSNKERPELSINVLPYATRSLDDELEKSVGGDIPLLAIAYTLMIAFASATLGKPLHKLKGRAALATADVFIIIFASGAGYGLSSMIGTPFTALVQVLPFILIAIGIDSAYIIAGAFDDSWSTSKDVYTRIEEAMSFAGVSVTVTSGTDVVAFLLTTTSVLPAVQWFGIYAAFSVLFIFFAQITVFPALLVLDEQRRNADRADFLCCIKLKQNDGDADEGKVPDESRDTRIQRFFGKVYGPLLTRPAVKLVVLTVFIVATALLGWQAMALDNNFELRDLAPDNSYLQDTFALLEQLYGSTSNGLPTGLYFRDVDHSELAVQQEIRRLSDETLISDVIDTTKGRFDWHLSFTQWIQSQQDFNSSIQSGFLVGASFVPALIDFLSQPEFAQFQDDIVLSEDQIEIISSRIIFFHENGQNSEQEIENLESTEEIAANSTLAPDVFFSVEAYVFFDQFRIITDQTVRSLVFAVVAVLMIASILLIHPLLVLICAVTLGMQFICLLGSMPAIFGISLNSISLVNMLLSIAIVVDYQTHVLYAFATMNPSISRDERMIMTLHKVGGPVLLAVCTTFLGILPLAFASSEVFRVFFQMFMGIVLFGGTFGLIFIPVLLSLIGPAVVRPDARMRRFSESNRSESSTTHEEQQEANKH